MYLCNYLKVYILSRFALIFAYITEYRLLSYIFNYVEAAFISRNVTLKYKNFFKYKSIKYFKVSKFAT